MGLKFLSSEVAPHCIALSFLFVSACVPGNDIGTKIPQVNVDVIADQTTEVSKPTLDNPGLSDENDFDAVAERQTIESDAERLKRNQEVYTIIKPTNVPRRPGTNIPNVVEYALKTNNPLGTMLYERRFKSQARFERNCNRHVSDSSAQEAFLSTGGPERDQFGIDPDGDGFACRWDPRPFRLAVEK